MIGSFEAWSLFLEALEDARDGGEDYSWMLAEICTQLFSLSLLFGCSIKLSQFLNDSLF